MNLDKFCAMSFRKANIFADFKFDRMGLIHLSLASGGGKTFAESPRGFHPETFATYYYSIMRCNSWSKTFQYNQREQVYAALKPTKDLVDIVIECATGRVTDDGILPAGQGDAPASVLAVIQISGPLLWSFEGQTLTSCCDRYRIADLGLDFNNVGHEFSLPLIETEIGLRLR